MDATRASPTERCARALNRRVARVLFVGTRACVRACVQMPRMPSRHPGERKRGCVREIARINPHSCDAMRIKRATRRSSAPLRSLARSFARSFARRPRQFYYSPTQAGARVCSCRFARSSRVIDRAATYYLAVSSCVRRTADLQSIYTDLIAVK